jgi:hypothetical protein
MPNLKAARHAPGLKNSNRKRLATAGYYPTPISVMRYRDFVT